MKKLIALLLALVFCWQALPQNVLADMINSLPTAEEMAAAVATTGLAEGAAVYHEGMPISKSMTATQMKGWIEEYQNRKLAYIMDTFENYDVELSYVKEQYPVTYEMLKGFSEAGIGLLYDNYSKAMDLRDEVAYYHNTLAQAASRTYTLIQVKQDHFTWLALVGGLVTLLGLVLAFYIQPARAWAVRDEDGADEFLRRPERKNAVAGLRSGVVHGPLPYP